MTFLLSRTDYTSTGIYGQLLTDSGVQVAVTLEHAYPVEGSNSPAWAPKLPLGVYTCLRGDHRLDGQPGPFTTFEVMDVPGHSGILFHWGNYNKDSAGCVLLGQARQGDMITHSRSTFALFMNLLHDAETFDLVVRDSSAASGV